MNEIYVIDTETSNTGFKDGKPVGGHIVEIGVAKVNLDSMTVKQLYGFIVRDETADKEAWVFKNTSLSYDEVMNGHERGEVAKMLGNKLAGERVTAYNIAFDHYMLEQDMPYINDCVSWTEDIMVQAAMVEEIPRKHAGGDCYPRAEAAYNYLCPSDPCRLHGHELHRAVYDAEMEGYILLELYKRGLWGNDE